MQEQEPQVIVVNTGPSIIERIRRAVRSFIGAMDSRKKQEARASAGLTGPKYILRDIAPDRYVFHKGSNTVIRYSTVERWQQEAQEVAALRETPSAAAIAETKRYQMLKRKRAARNRVARQRRAEHAAHLAGLLTIINVPPRPEM